jgi:quercetin dioxygenase-like cupin family protein
MRGLGSLVVQSWNLLEIETPGGSRSPVVLRTDNDARAVLIGLDPGQALGDHEVKEEAFVVVLDGDVRVQTAGESVTASAGTMFHFAPQERRSVASTGGARLLLVFAPWPGAGHYRGELRAG